MLAQLVAITDSGQHQQLRAVDRAAAQHHFTPCPHHASGPALVELDTDGMVPVEEDLRRSGLGQKSEVRPFECGPQVSIRRAPSGAAALCDACFAEALGLSLIGLLDLIAAFLYSLQPCGGGSAWASLLRD